MNDRKKEVIYEMQCKDCEKVYVGETNKKMKTRLHEHKQAVVNFELNNVVSADVHREHHQRDWEGTKVVGEQEFRSSSCGLL